MSSLPRRNVDLRYPEANLKQARFEVCFQAALEKAGFSQLVDVRDQFVNFDLARTRWHDLGTLLWFISLLNRLKQQGNEIQIRLPEPGDDSAAENLWHFLNRWRFFVALRQCVDDPVNILLSDQLPYTKVPSKYSSAAMGVDEYGEETTLHTARILEITTITSSKTEALSGNSASEASIDLFLQKYHDQIILSALSGLCGWDHSETKQFIRQVVEEGMRNALFHGQGTFLAIAMRLDQRNLTLAICDNGVGIPAVLRAAFTQAGRGDISMLSDVELIKYFTEPDLILDSRLIEISTRSGVTTKPTHRGVGLYYLKSLILEKRGRLRIRSGSAAVDFVNGEVMPSDRLLHSPGTLFRIITPLKR